MRNAKVVDAAKRAGRTIVSDADSKSLRSHVTWELRTLHTAVENTQKGRWADIKARSGSAFPTKKK